MKPGQSKEHDELLAFVEQLLLNEGRMAAQAAANSADMAARFDSFRGQAIQQGDYHSRQALRCSQAAQLIAELRTKAAPVSSARTAGAGLAA